jgi:hypothetical protein
MPPALVRRVFLPAALTGILERISSLEVEEVESQLLDWEDGAVLEQREEGSDSHSERGERATTDVGEVEWAG